MSTYKVEVVDKGNSPTGEDMAIGVISVNGVEIGPAFPLDRAHAVRTWLNWSLEFLVKSVTEQTETKESEPKPEGFFLDIVGSDGEPFRLETPSPILGVNDASEMFILFGGNPDDMPDHWRRMYNPYGPPSRGQRLLIANHAMDLWNIFNRRQLVGTAPKKL